MKRSQQNQLRKLRVGLGVTVVQVVPVPVYYEDCTTDGIFFVSFVLSTIIVLIGVTKRVGLDK